MKDIIIIADFCGPLDGTYNSRFLYLAEMLVEEGHNVEILTSDFEHGSKKHIDYEIEKHSYKITLLHESSYPKNVCLRRFYGHFIWGINVKKYLKKRKKPDVVYCAVPTLFASYEAAKYCEKNKIKFVVDIQDLWPESFRLAFDVPIISDIVFLPFDLLANAIYKRADEICAVSKTFAERASRVNPQNVKTNVAFLGTELESFDGNVKENFVNKPDKEFWIGYCGSMGDSYDLWTVIDAMHILNQRGICNVKLIAMGDGEHKIAFEQYAKEKKIDCLFTGRLPYNVMCGRLAACDVVINPIVGKSVASIINKHSDYAASGLPVINTQNSKEYRGLIHEYKMGFNCKNGDAAGVADKILRIRNNKKLRIKMGMNARRCAEEKFDRKRTYRNLINSICG